MRSDQKLTDALCTRCGLCCDGSLFADVELASRREASALEVMGLEIEDADEDGGGLLVQPCRALKGTRCSIYSHRPNCCRTFECRLLRDVQRGTLDVDQAQEKIAEALMRIRQVKELLAPFALDDQSLTLKERCVEALALSEEVGAAPALARKRAELESAMTIVESLIQETFLGD